jgi:hypothetical protein
MRGGFLAFLIFIRTHFFNEKMMPMGDGLLVLHKPFSYSVMFVIIYFHMQKAVEPQLSTADGDSRGTVEIKRLAIDVSVRSTYRN